LPTEETEVRLFRSDQFFSRCFEAEIVKTRLLIIKIMSKEKEGKEKSDKKAPLKSLKEKRAEKASKRLEKGKEESL
jgi:hypothetical protein